MKERKKDTHRKRKRGERNDVHRIEAIFVIRFKEATRFELDFVQE